MHWHWYDIVFVLIALSIISDMNKPKEPKPPKVADLFPSIRLAAKAERRARRAAAWKEWRAALLIISGALAFLVLLLLIKAPENLLWALPVGIVLLMPALGVAMAFGIQRLARRKRVRREAVAAVRTAIDPVSG
jgi:hypothetical protein